MIQLPDRTTTDEQVVTHMWNSSDRYQIVTDGPDVTCPFCGYPERHRLYEDVGETLALKLVADGCPMCEKSRMPIDIAPRCPECRDGKCRNCVGEALTTRTGTRSEQDRVRSSFGDADAASARRSVSDEKARDLVERSNRVSQDHTDGSL